MADGNVVRLHQPTKRVIRLTDEERQLLLEELTEITAEIDALSDRAAEIAERVQDPARLARPA
ncbi:hypothetical protein [Actinocorallia longicatena]|uniref:Uncharacterized protein n=1 Tax=Actinocorallia longicatena TaxID=111803 RepID=A0ABP6QA00_9ACTN